MTLVQFTPKSGNEKTGPIPVSMSPRSTCPDSCSFKGVDENGKLRGCYAEGWPLRIHWDAVESKGVDWQTFCNLIADLPNGQLWRHNQAGDLSGANDRINASDTADLARANEGKRGFTYTHYPTNATALARVRAEYEKTGRDTSHLTTELTRHNRAVVADAVLRGFTINVSHDSLEELDSGTGDALPSVVVLPKLEKGQAEPKVTYSPGGRKVVTCPAQWRDDFSCAQCKLCADATRTYTIGFRSHGIANRRVSNLVSAGQLNRKKSVA